MAEFKKQQELDDPPAVPVSKPQPSSIVRRPRRVHFPEPTSTAFISPPHTEDTTSTSDESFRPQDAITSEITIEELERREQVLQQINNPCNQQSSANRSVEALQVEALQVEDLQVDILADVRVLPERFSQQGNVSQIQITEAYNTPCSTRSHGLVSLDEIGMSPLLIIMMGMPMLSIGSYVGAVGAMSHGIKTILSGTKVAGKQVLFPKTPYPSPPGSPPTETVGLLWGHGARGACYDGVTDGSSSMLSSVLDLQKIFANNNERTGDS
ncbi:hypothetical protein EDC01DRAFT_273126 [Geopyxis carbonaria]|nr:hypothetical protein EDC01DRAFT_273126 [Geopyxis carbonaria]